jgi:hypothetical protein
MKLSDTTHTNGSTFLAIKDKMTVLAGQESRIPKINTSKAKMSAQQLPGTPSAFELTG